MEKFLLTHNTSAGLAGYNLAVKLTHEDLTEATAATAQTIAVHAVKLGTVVKGCAAFLKAPFADASDAAFNSTAITVGDGVDPDRFLTSTELNVNGTEVLAKATANAVATLPFAYVAADTIDVVVNAMAAKALVDIDAGEVWIFLEIAELAEAAKD